MKGNYFLEIHPETGALLTQGKVLKRIDNDHWLIAFAGKVPHNRVVPSKNMVSMNLFDSEQHMDAWIQANRVRTAPVPGKHSPKDGDVIKITKKDVEDAREINPGPEPGLPTPGGREELSQEPDPIPDPDGTLPPEPLPGADDLPIG